MNIGSKRRCIVPRDLLLILQVSAIYYHSRDDYFTVRIRKALPQTESEY